MLPLTGRVNNGTCKAFTEGGVVVAFWGVAFSKYSFVFVRGVDREGANTFDFAGFCLVG